MDRNVSPFHGAGVSAAMIELEWFKSGGIRKSKLLIIFSSQCDAHSGPAARIFYRISLIIQWVG
ncbi:hypothetical protein [Paraburkholderia sp. BCC1886]|uniref:hypothetical protein n=1 Tax=Paraburkholderia sp. BCC1886 TaxID=2562670 RepID=UPI00118380ED|nr:hypothetical protein [Paraburkholderia sp. BCC1886]